MPDKNPRTVLIMHRNGGTIDFDQNCGGIYVQLVEEYLRGDPWWELRCNDSIWIVPGTASA